MFTKLKLLILSIGCFLAAHGSQAVEQVNGQYVWSFASEEAWPSGYNQNTGKPDNLIYAANEYPAGFFDRINNALPEAEVNEAFLTGDQGSNITLVEEAEVFVTFLHEGAGYKNSFGYFTYDVNNPPTDINDIRETIIFPNLSYPHLTTGHRVNLGTFPSGTTIGFFIAANGFWYYTGVKPFASPFYYSIKDLNPDPTDELRQHNVLLLDQEVSEVIIGFEDLPRSWGDNDFNDAVFSVKVSPASALASDNLTVMPAANDADADGVDDAEDEFPSDYTRAFSSYFPSADDWVTLAFEDNWPNVGDYDMNDLVIRKRLRTTYNANGDITGFQIQGYIDARGASFHNGFALHLVDFSPEIIESATLEIAGETHEKLPEEFQSEAVLVLWQDSHVYTPTGESDSCSHFNTKKGCTEFDPVAFSLDVAFSTPPEALNYSALDFFIFRKNYRGREIHFADYAPTDLFDFSQLGKKDDTSDENTGRFFRTQNNLPWALKVHTNWCYPREYIDVVWAYPDYEAWVESSGDSATDWFATSDRDTHYFCRQDNAFVAQTTTQTGNSDSLSCEVINFNQWADGYQLDVKVTNTSQTSVEGWSVALAFDADPAITNSWSTSLSTNGSTVTASHLSWNKIISSGADVSFGFQGSLENYLAEPTCTVQ